MNRGILRLAIAGVLLAPAAPALAQQGEGNETILEEVQAVRHSIAGLDEPE